MRAMKSLGKTLVALFLGILGLCLIAHFALNYGITLDLTTFFKKYWLFWIVVRLVLYTILGVYIYKIRDSENIKRLVIACVIWIVAIEYINVMQLLRTGG